MNPWVGGLLAIAALAVGWLSYGWQGVVLAVTMIAFGLLLQFNRIVRVMRNAAQSPVGHVPSALMLQAKLQVGKPMVQVVALAKSLGRRTDGPDEVYTWTDDGGVALTVTFVDGRCARWTLVRPPEA